MDQHLNPLDSAAIPPPPEHVPASPGRILIVEDQGVVATDIGRCLEDRGFEVTGIATSMQDAIRKASEARPDLILMDIRIKGEADGIAAADYLHRHFDLPIVYLTAHDDVDTMERAKRTQPMAFLLKPFKPAELTSTVELALNRDRTERQLRERERSFLSAMDAIGDGVLTTDSQARIRFMNRAAQTLTGWSQELALGRPATDVLRAVDAQEGASQQFQGLFFSDRAADSGAEYRIATRSDDPCWLMLKATSIPGAANGSIRVVVMQDIGRRKQAEEALRRQADLLNQSHEPILTWSWDGTIRYWNQGAEKLYGYTAMEALNLPLSRLLPSDCHSDRVWEAALKTDGRWSGELRRRTKDGREIVVEALLVVVQDGTGDRTVLETDRDVTDRKATELEIRRLNVELRARVHELTLLTKEQESFNYSVSHDLRAPLRHINGFAKILRRDVAASLSADSREHLDSISEAAQKMGSMVDALLELSRASRREPARSATDIKSLVETLAGEVKSDIGDRQVKWEIGNLPSVECDPTLVRQVFANLLLNALKFSFCRKPAIIEVGCTPSAGETVFFVKDNGVGFNMQYADKLFGVFQRLHRPEDFEGTGIGLALVNRIVQKHGGRIWAEGEIDKGAAFYFTLEPPAQQEARTFTER